MHHAMKLRRRITMEPSNWLSDFEIRFCSAFTVVCLVIFGVTINLFLYPLGVYYFTSTSRVDCEVRSTSSIQKIPCDFSSCSDSCTADEVPCLEYTATTNNSTYPLVAGLFNCGIYVNCTYFREFVKPGKTFKCEIFRSGGRYVVSPRTSAGYAIYLGLTSLPLLLLLSCILYVGYRKIIERGYPDERTKNKKTAKPSEPKSFYQRKLLELERLKKEREERERIARYNDSVRVESLNTVTALVFKPSSSWMEPTPDVSVIDEVSVVQQLPQS